MGKNELVARNVSNTAVATIKDPVFKEEPVVEYALVDLSKYSFDYQWNDDINIRMFESDRFYDSDEFIDAEYVEDIDEKEIPYYALAAASGIITGIFSHLKLSKESFQDMGKWQRTESAQFFIYAAQMLGFKKDDLKGAVAFLKERIIPFAKEEMKTECDEGLKAALKILSNHPSVAGLAFSVLAQFTGRYFAISDDHITNSLVPDYYAIGRNDAEKIALEF